MTNLQSLSVFVTERLTLAAQEIFKAVEVTVTEYHEEISRSRQENELLKRRLLEAGIDFYTELPPGLSVLHDDGEAMAGLPACGEQWAQQSEEIQVKLELSAAQEESQDSQPQLTMDKSISPKLCLQNEQQMEEMIHPQTSESSMDTLLHAGPYMQIKEEPSEPMHDLRSETFFQSQTSISADPSTAIASSHTSGLEDELDSHRLSSMHKAVRSKIMLRKRKFKKDNLTLQPSQKKSSGLPSLKPDGKKEQDRGKSAEEDGKDGEETKPVYKVLGRLTVQGKYYMVNNEELKRRVKAENMSANVFRALIRVAKRHLPTDVLQQPKKAKTKVTIFSALTEGEAQDLAEGFYVALERHVPKDKVLEGVPKEDIPAAYRTIQKMRKNFQNLGPESAFDLLTHRFGPTATERFFGFLEESML